MKRALLSLLLCLALASLAVASPQAGADGRAALEKLLRAPALRGARVGVAVADLETGKPVVEENSRQPLVPASNQKLLVASAALAHWGPAHRFETPVFVDGELDAKGVLSGALWIQGRGDPGFTSEALWKLAEEIRLHGVSRIRGGIGIDVSYFDRHRFHPDWEPVSARAYHAPTSAFAANYSSFRIEVSPARQAGLPALVAVAPITPYFRTRSEAVTAPGVRRLELALEPLPDGSGERVRVRGSIPAGSKPRTYWRRVALPERYAASLLRSQLETQGVRVGGSLRLGVVPDSARPLLHFEGEPLGQIIWKLNKFSNNFIAEQLTKALGAAVLGEPGSWEKGAEAIRAHLRGLGIDGRQTIVADGSGLSPRNRVSAATLTEIARRAALRFESGAEFLASLPLGGLDGTLEDRLNDGAPPVRGKTGHLRHVASLSGLVARGQRRLVFTVLVNGARGNQLDVDAAIDTFVTELSLAAEAE